MDERVDDCVEIFLFLMLGKVHVNGIFTFEIHFFIENVDILQMTWAMYSEFP